MPLKHEHSDALVFASANTFTPDGVRRSYLVNGGVETNTNRGTAGVRPWQDHRLNNPVVVRLASLINPSTTISITETKGINISDPQATWISCFTEPSRTFTNHLGTANFLFLDGHVKAMKPTYTATPLINMWTDNNATSVPSAAVGASAFMQTDMAQAEEVMPGGPAGSCP